MFTSCYSRLKRIPADLEPVAISEGIPSWFKGKRESRLAPTTAMRRMALPDMVATYRAYLDEIAKDESKVQALAESLGPRAVLLCWEPPGFACHRRIVAEWFEKLLKVEIPELGFPRSLLLPFDDLPMKDAPPSEYPWKAKCDHCGKQNRVRLGDREWLCGKCGMFFTIEWEE